jgi:hypothetical protein
MQTLRQHGGSIAVACLALSALAGPLCMLPKSYSCSWNPTYNCSNSGSLTLCETDGTEAPNGVRGRRLSGDETPQMRRCWTYSSTNAADWYSAPCSVPPTPESEWVKIPRTGANCYPSTVTNCCWVRASSASTPEDKNLTIWPEGEPCDGLPPAPPA